MISLLFTRIIFRNNELRIPFQIDPHSGKLTPHRGSYSGKHNPSFAFNFLMVDQIAPQKMHEFNFRHLALQLDVYMQLFPAVAILGPRP
jgi:hypothetical protein